MTPHLTGTPVLETERLILRAPEAPDMEVWTPFFLSDRARFIGGGPDWDAGRAWRAFASFIGQWAINGFGTFTLVRRDTGAPVGGAGPWYPALWPERELGWTCWDPEAEGKGYMSEAVRRIQAHVFEDLGWDTAVSYVDIENERSLALAERVGCVLDPEARDPEFEGVTAVVYRHTAPGDVS